MPEPAGRRLPSRRGVPAGLRPPAGGPADRLPPSRRPSPRVRPGAAAVIALLLAAAAVVLGPPPSPPPPPPPSPPAPGQCAGAGGFDLPFRADQVLPICRFAAAGRLLDKLPEAAAVGQAKPYDRYGRAHNGGKAKIFLAGFVASPTPIPLEDSLGNVFATVTQTAPGCFAFALRQRPAGFPSDPNNCPPPGGPARARSSRLRIEILAPPCMSQPSRALARDGRGRLAPASYLIDFVPAPGDRGSPPAATGTFAIVPAAYLTPPPAAIPQIVAAYPGNLDAGLGSLGCGRPGDFGAPPGPALPMTRLDPAPSTRPPPGAPRGAAPLTAANSIYLNQGNYAGCAAHPPPPCRLDSYLNYYLAWAPSVRYLVSSTTAISSATAARPAGRPPSGVIRAILQDTPTQFFRVYGDVSYADGNVPCGQQRTARWQFGDANPNDPSPDHHIFGWLLTYDYQGPRRC